MPEPDSPRALLLDFDGTIADTLPLIFDSFRFAVSPWAERLPTDAEVEATFGPAERSCLAVFAPEHCLDEAEARFFDHYEREHDRMVRLVEGIAGAIEHARFRSWKVGVFTGKGRRAARFSLRALGLLDRVDCVVSGDDVDRPKPDPDGILRAAELLGVSPSRILMVGDSPADIRAGLAAGSLTCAVSWAAFEPHRLEAESPHHRCSRVDELITLIDSLHADPRG
ncbi:HAD family hydrolase [Tautonia sociabilis]|uniref:phosphoglycolate phosphatase n=1 Tax=Tautonia sociabilis TaxID=2080755 RepID=A0A432MHN2_9BACT|nr:HAD-IA family hydrolase [Tautonia sociabilis]RUL86860.1 HAD family hydrolase [Tautonia sociabilis]